MDTLLEELIHSPQLPQYYHQIGTLLAEEQRRRQEFYQTISESDKAEFINGEIIYHSPVKLRHTEAAGNLLVLLRTFVQLHNLGFVGYEKTMLALSRNDYEPNICFFRRERAAQFSPDQIKFPAPDFVVEVLSPSTEQIDRGIKFEDYAAHGVAEYWIIDPEQRIAEQYILQDERYTLLTKARSGVLASTAVEGFVIPIGALFDQAENLAALQAIVKSADRGA